MVNISNTTMNDIPLKQRAIGTNNNGWVETKPARSELRSKLNEFVANSTIHGLNQLNMSKPFIRRAIWSIVFLMCIITLCAGVIEDVKKYFQYDIVVSSLIQQNSSLPFPAVTLCTIGTLKKSRLSGHVMQDLVDYTESDANGEKPKAINGSRPFDLKKALDETGFDIQDLLCGCQWQGEACGAENFTSIIDLQAGKCFTFNSRKENQLITTDGGTESDLMLLLDANPDEMQADGSDSVGFRIQVHEPGEVPSIVKEGDTLTTGFRYKVAMTRHKSILLESPYPSHCSKDPAAVTGACKDQCMKDAMYKTCNCSVTETIGQRLCTLKESSCFAKVYGKPLHCPCPLPCERVIYETDISSSYFPAPHMWPSFFKKFNVTSANESDFQKNFRNRYTKVYVTYRNLHTTIWKEQAAYEYTSLCADLGGTMGLCLGCSFLSLCEVVDLLVSFVCLRVRRATGRRVEHSADDKETVCAQQT